MLVPVLTGSWTRRGRRRPELQRPVMATGKSSEVSEAEQGSKEHPFFGNRTRETHRTSYRSRTESRKRGDAGDGEKSAAAEVDVEEIRRAGEASRRKAGL